MRRTEVVLDTPTEAGDAVLYLLTMLPAMVADALAMAALYQARWTIEGLFGRLDAVFAGEVAMLDHPRAALLAFSVAVIANNAFTVMQAALTAQAHGVDTSAEVVAPSAVLVAVTPEVWTSYDAAAAASLAMLLQQLATRVPLAALRKHPRAASAKRPKGDASANEVRRKCATARLFEDAKQRRSAP